MTDRAVLLLAYGGPDTLEDVAAYLQDVRGGRPTSPEIVEDVRRRYAAIGGGSPLLARTREQAAALADVLRDGWRVSIGMRHWHPYIKDAIEGLAKFGTRRIVALPMAPHYSDMSVGAYRRACESAPSVAAGDVGLAFVPGFSAHAGFLRAVEERTTSALARMGKPAGEVLVVFTAHSLPERILAAGDPYADRLAESARAVADRLCLPQWRVAYQSAGRTHERWLGPDAGQVLEEAAAAGVASVLIVPIGFVCDHVEVLYDVDIAYQQQAARLGVQLARSESLNASTILIDALADLVRGAAKQAGWA